VATAKRRLLAPSERGLIRRLFLTEEIIMKRWMGFAAALATTLLLLTGLETAVSASANANTVSGEVRNIDGRSYVIQGSGRE
jgi:hypothetical protein